MRILSVSEMRALESTADMAGQSYAQMMEMAGQGVALAILHHMSIKGRRILVLVGPGNNGGDGLVAARLLKDAGANVTAYLTRERDAGQDRVYQQAKQHKVTMVTAKADAHKEELSRLVSQSHTLIDALLGTGATPPLHGEIAEVLDIVHQTLEKTRRNPLTTLNALPCKNNMYPLIVAVDGPSGMDFDTGEVDTLTLKAHITVTFATPKWGHFSLPGAEYIGKLITANIGIPQGIDIPGDRTEVVTPDLVKSWLPSRPLDAHKGTFGKALIVAGSANYTGAAALAASAAVRAGVGLVTLALPSMLHSAIVPAVPEATYLLLPHALGVLDEPAVSLVVEKTGGYSAMLVGPGLSHTPETTSFVRGLLGLTPKKRGTGFVSSPAKDTHPPALPPLVIDADGLNILSEIPQWSEILPQECVLTPHPGEMARLTGMTTKEIQAKRIDIARKYATEWGHIVVLKGAFTVIANPKGETMLLPFANPGLSSAGTGDVLAGSIVALRAQGLSAFKAAVSGTYLHALAGEIVRDKLGIAGIAASDVAAALPLAWQQLCSAKL